MSDPKVGDLKIEERANGRYLAFQYARNYGHLQEAFRWELITSGDSEADVRHKLACIKEQKESEKRARTVVRTIYV